jgi:hypothetical protein
MVNRDARDRLQRSLHDLINGIITNDSFVHEMPKDGADRALMPIWHFGDGLYSDASEYRLAGRYSVPEDLRLLAERCCLFLSTDLEYEWPDHPADRFSWGYLFRVVLYLLFSVGVILFFIWHSATGKGLFIVTFTLVALFSLVTNVQPCKKQWRLYWSHGDKEVWPFLRWSDYQEAGDSQTAEDQ